MLVVPSFFDDLHKKFRGGQKYLMQEKTVTPSIKNVDNIKAIMGLVYPGNTMSSPISNEFPTELAIIVKLLLERGYHQFKRKILQ